MPTPADTEAIVICTRDARNKRLRGWVMHLLGSDPESDWSLYEPDYCTEYPWRFNPDQATDPFPGKAGKQGKVTGKMWRQPTQAVRDLLKRNYILLVEDERISRTITRYRG